MHCVYECILSNLYQSFSIVSFVSFCVVRFVKMLRKFLKEKIELIGLNSFQMIGLNSFQIYLWEYYCDNGGDKFIIDRSCCRSSASKTTGSPIFPLVSSPFFRIVNSLILSTRPLQRNEIKQI